MTWVVAEESAGVRLDKFLAAPDRLGSRGKVTAALDHGKVFLNGIEANRGHAGSLLQTGDVIRLWMDRPGTAKKRPSATLAAELGILYEDESLIVLNKPAGLLSVPLTTSGDTSAYEQMAVYLRAQGRRGRPFVVHRIDRDTSGLVVFAKNERAQELLKAQFRRREPERMYWAVVYGHPAPSRGVWRDRLIWDQDALIQRRTHPDDPKGADATSHYRVLETLRETSLVEIRLETGKRNQIRIQARLRGHTLVGERRYTFGPDSLRPIECARQALHARELGFVHPATGRPLRFEAPLPADLAELLTRLRSG